MKKFLIVLLLLIIASGVVFYFGWMQLRIPANSYAVIFSKTGGVEKTAVKSGDFVWRLKKIIPKNVTLYIFSASPVEKSIVLEGALPSADTYASIIEGKPDFTYRAEFSIHISVNPDKLPFLVENQGLLPDNLGSLFDEIGNMAANRALNLLSEKIQNGSFGSFEDSFLSGFDEDLTTRLNREFEDVVIHDIKPVSVRMPDMELYALAKSNYFEMIKLHQEILLEETEALTAKEAADNRRINLLHQYGELLTQYPILLDFMKLEAGVREPSGSFFNSADAP